MKNIYVRLLVTALILANVSLSKAQNGVAINTMIAPTPYNVTNQTGAILDLSNNNTPGHAGFLPPYALLTNATTLAPVVGTGASLNGVLVYNTNTAITSGLSGPGLYYWSNPAGSWIFMTTNNSANNGLSVPVANTVELGGNLIHSTYDTLNGYTLGIIPSGASALGMNITTTGQVGIGNNSPDANAILDLQNTNNWVLALPTMITANLPAAGGANGLFVANSSCLYLEAQANGAWVPFVNIHGSIAFAVESVPDNNGKEAGVSSFEQSWIVPNCITQITITAAGGRGGKGKQTYGSGAIVSAVITTVPGQTLDIIVGDSGGGERHKGGGGGGGGGGSFIWDYSNSGYPLIVAGGGGGGGYVSTLSGVTKEGQGANASLTTAVTTSAGGFCGTGGVNGNGGAQGAIWVVPNTQQYSGGAGGGGGGWFTAGTPAAATPESGQGGFGRGSKFQGGKGADTNSPAANYQRKYFNHGGYGGGGGGGFYQPRTQYRGAGGGGGGWNGGGGGNTVKPAADNGYGGGGGSSMFYNGGSPYNVAGDVANPTAIGQNKGAGYVVIFY